VAELQPTPIQLDTEDPWRVFKIMNEFVAGFEALANLPPAVAFFGSSRATPEDPAYALAEKTARLLAANGFTVLTGGGPGSATQTMGLTLYRIGFVDFKFGNANALAFLVLLFNLTLIAVLLRLFRERGAVS